MASALSLIPTPAWNDRLGHVASRTTGLMNASKLVENTTAFAAHFFQRSEATNQVAGALTHVSELTGVFRLGCRFADLAQDIATPKGDKHEEAMKWVELVAFTGSDAANIVSSLSNQGFYDLGEAKGYLDHVSAALGALGVATGIVEKSYVLDRMKKAGAPTELQTNVALEIAEKVVDFVAIIFGVLSFVLPVVFIPLVALFSVAAAVLALVRLWRESAYSALQEQVATALPQTMNLMGRLIGRFQEQGGNLDALRGQEPVSPGVAAARVGDFLSRIAASLVPSGTDALPPAGAGAGAGAGVSLVELPDAP